MKVLQVVDGFSTGGGPEYVRLLASGLPEIEFGLLGFSGTPSRALSDLPNTRWLGEVGVRRAVAEFRPDVVHCNHLRALLRLGLAFPARRTFRVVNTVHGVHLRRYAFLGGLWAAVKGGARRRLEGGLIRGVDANIFLTESDRTYASQRFGEVRGTVIPNGIAAEADDPPPPFDLGSRSPDPAAVQVLCIARFNFQKGVDILVRGIASFRALTGAPSPVFHLVGTGEEMEACRTLAGSLGVQDRMVFHGDVPGARALLRQADLLVLPSRWEGFPLVLLEAAVRGVPVLASDACGNSDLVEDGRNGRLFRNGDPSSLADGLARAMADREGGKRMADLLRRKVRQEYTLERMAGATAEVYASVRRIGEGKRGAA